MSRYRATLSRISESVCSVEDGGLNHDLEPTIKDLARRVSATENSSNAVDMVDVFLGSTRLPSFDGSLSGGRGKLHVDSCQLAALVTFDLAVCSRASSEVSRQLLQVAQGKLNSAGTKHCPQISTSLKSFIEDMIKLLDVVTARQCASMDFPWHDSLASLLAMSTWPLAADEYQHAVGRLLCLEKAVTQTADVLIQHSMHPATNCLCSCTPDELLGHLSKVFHTTLPRGGLLSLLQRFVPCHAS